MLQIAVTGKPNVGKSSFFNSATLSKVEVANYPFTTIDANKAIAHVKSVCPCKEMNVECNPRNSQCIDGTRLIPIELIDVAGLVPGAHEGKGLGNKFLDDLTQAKVLIHVIDASGSTDEEGNPVEAGSYDPLNDIDFLESEFTHWMYNIISRNWQRLVRKALSEHLDMSKVLFDQLSGLGVKLEDIIEANRKMDTEYDKWNEEEMLKFLTYVLRIAKPTIIVANKADLPTSKENIKKLQEKYDYVIPCSAESELALKKANELGLIKYESGENNFEILDDSKLNKNQKTALEYIRTHVLDEYGSTGIQEALNIAIFKLLDMIVVYPVEDEHKLSDQKGNVLPDAVLVPRGSVPKKLAYMIHTDIGDSFMYAIDARNNMRIASNHELEDGDIISIVCR